MVYTSATPKYSSMVLEERPIERRDDTGEKKMGMLTEARGCGDGRKDHKLRTLGGMAEACRS